MVLIIIFLISIVISAYHVGIENNIFPEFSGCTVDNINIMTQKAWFQFVMINFTIMAGIRLATSST